MEENKKLKIKCEEYEMENQILIGKLASKDNELKIIRDELEKIMYSRTYKITQKLSKILKRG